MSMHRAFRFIIFLKLIEIYQFNCIINGWISESSDQFFKNFNWFKFLWNSQGKETGKMEDKNS